MVHQPVQPARPDLLVHPPVAEPGAGGQVDPRGGVGLVPGQADLAGQQQLAAADSSGAARHPLHVVHGVAAPRHVQAVHLAVAEREPGRPGDHQGGRVVAGVAAAGSGETTSRAATAYGSRPALASVCRARMAPPGTASISVASRRPASSSAASIRARDPPCSVRSGRNSGVLRQQRAAPAPAAAPPGPSRSRRGRLSGRGQHSPGRLSLRPPARRPRGPPHAGREAGPRLQWPA